MSTGTHALSGRDFLPGDQFLQGVPSLLGEQAGATRPVDQARKAAAVGGDATILLGKAGSTASGVVFVLIPEGAGGSTTANPRFARTPNITD